MLILGLTGLLLILACINLGGLLLSRLNARSAELAVRLALGGSRWRIAQQMLVENGMLSLAGALLAMPVVYFTAVTLASFMPPINVPYTISFVPDAARVRAHDRCRDHGRHRDERAAGLVCHAPQLRRRHSLGSNDRRHDRMVGTRPPRGAGVAGDCHARQRVIAHAIAVSPQYRRSRDPPRQPAYGQDLVVAAAGRCTVERTATVTIRRSSRRCARCRV